MISNLQKISRWFLFLDFLFSISMSTFAHAAATPAKVFVFNVMDAYKPVTGSTDSGSFVVYYRDMEQRSFVNSMALGIGYVTPKGEIYELQIPDSIIRFNNMELGFDGLAGDINITWYVPESMKSELGSFITLKTSSDRGRTLTISTNAKGESTNTNIVYERVPRDTVTYLKGSSLDSALGHFYPNSIDPSPEYKYSVFAEDPDLKNPKGATSVNYLNLLIVAVPVNAATQYSQFEFVTARSRKVFNPDSFMIRTVMSRGEMAYMSSMNGQYMAYTVGLKDIPIIDWDHKLVTEPAPKGILFNPRPLRLETRPDLKIHDSTTPISASFVPTVEGYSTSTSRFVPLSAYTNSWAQYAEAVVTHYVNWRALRQMMLPPVDPFYEMLRTDFRIKNTILNDCAKNLTPSL